MFCFPTRPLAVAVTLTFPLTTVLSGCASPGVLDAPPAPEASQTRVLRPEGTGLLRVGRYTLADTTPRSDQLDLLSQVIDIRLPVGVNPTVREAMGYVLRQSGYGLCPAGASGDVQVLYAHPLPAAHHQLGPITLRNALLALAGPAWQLEVDEYARRICFVARQGGLERLPTSTLPLSAALPEGGR
ncbi:PilL N-terminal domain-containing protein [Pseudomonas gingeri]|uniref:PFGI-1 class ICE element type IV pilus protein PilL2 n=1 Tax=Pseudomonas gingeri TaxID=117681 RepID=UPI0015A10620|nr:PilL N-terminal domain-containing protein [Pseudomonas gingeri]NWA02313.1 pilus assembly protein [Pseudomonas gingeri]NWA12514.1 pilus assembly protein [Pseudomonas gingeri]NWA57080.1 pilus assembly protein [Pseudomonas gingeri]NWA93423.1 pilus assembly protein [Pseudomonas gingeri]NWB02895.1 pilus assembly protein [Pseudomonas gingeri]